MVLHAFPLLQIGQRLLLKSPNVLEGFSTNVRAVLTKERTLRHFLGTADERDLGKIFPSEVVELASSAIFLTSASKNCAELRRMIREKKIKVLKRF